MATQMSGGYKAGTLTGTTATVSMAESPIPCSIQLTSSDASRAVQLSVDGTNFFTPTYDQSPATFLVVAVMAPVHSVKFTGTTNDTWVIR